MSIFKKAVLGSALAASTLVAAAPAQAQYYDGYRYRRHNDAGLAIGAGVLGLAVGAAIASNNRSRYYDNGYYNNGYNNGYYNNGYYNNDYYNRRYARPRYYDDYRYRQRCWVESYYDDYYDRTVRVRRCR